MGFGGTSPQTQMNLVNQQVGQNQRAYEDYVKMIQGIVGGSGYDFMAPRTTTTTQTGTTSGTRNAITDLNQLVMPEITGDYKKLEGMARGVAEDRLYQPLPPGMAERAARDTNAAFAGANTKISNEAARRGYSGLQTAGMMAPVESARASKIADLSVDIPLAEQEQQAKAVDLARSLTEAFGRGQRTTGQTRTSELTSGTSSGTGESTAPPDIMALLQYLGLLQPYERPIVQPGAQAGWGGPAIGAAGTIIGAAII